MIPKNITRDHIINAIREIKRAGVPRGRESTKFQLIFNGESFPPKYVVSLANKYANSVELSPSEFSGGIETNSFLESLRFDVVVVSSARVPKRPVITPKQLPKVTKSKHDERCPECKKTIEAMLRKLYGAVESNYKFEIGAGIEDYKAFSYYDDLEKIFTALQNYRGYKSFVRTPILPRCDFFIPNPGFVVEFDESQHFTTPRKLCLSHYPDSLKLGFPKERWIHLCDQIQAKDNDPAFRDEQRAWYDTLRDFLPEIKGLAPTVRLYSKDYQWCSLNPRSKRDIELFKNLLVINQPSSKHDQVLSKVATSSEATGTSGHNTFTVALVLPTVYSPSEDKIPPRCPPNIPSKFKPVIPKPEDFAEESIDLVVFPEAYIRYEDGQRLNSLCALASQLNTYILVGASKQHSQRKGDWETLVLIEPHGNRDIVYYKHSTADAVAFEFPNWNPRQRLTLFSIKGVNIGCTICHDSYLGLLQHYLAKRGAKIWINPSYDNVIHEKWDSIHRLRAIENGFISLCTLHDNLAKRNRREACPFGFAPDGRELRGYPPSRPFEARILSLCTKPGIYIVNCPIDAPSARKQPNLLPNTRKRRLENKHPRKRPVQISLVNGRPHIEVGGALLALDATKGELIDVNGMKIGVGFVPGDKLFDITTFTRLQKEIYNKDPGDSRPLFWNQWSELPAEPEQLVDIMLGRTLELLAPVVLSDDEKIYEITEIAGGTKTMRRISVNSMDAEVDMAFALGLWNSFKITWGKIYKSKGLQIPPDCENEYFEPFVQRYLSLCDI